MVIEKDEEVKVYQKEDFQKTSDRVIDLNSEIERLDKKIKAVKSATLTYENFLELFDNMAKSIAEKQPMATLDAKLKKVFSNFITNKKSVEGYTLNEPFASLERLETGKVSNGAGLLPYLELLQNSTEMRVLMADFVKAYNLDQEITYRNNLEYITI